MIDSMFLKGSNRKFFLFHVTVWPSHLLIQEMFLSQNDGCVISLMDKFSFYSVKSRTFACWNMLHVRRTSVFSRPPKVFWRTTLALRGKGPFRNALPPCFPCSLHLCVPVEWLLSIKGCQSMPRTHFLLTSPHLSLLINMLQGLREVVTWWLCTRPYKKVLHTWDRLSINSILASVLALRTDGGHFVCRDTPPFLFTEELCIMLCILKSKDFDANTSNHLKHQLKK